MKNSIKYVAMDTQKKQYSVAVVYSGTGEKKARLATKNINVGSGSCSLSN